MPKPYPVAIAPVTLAIRRDLDTTQRLRTGRLRAVAPARDRLRAASVIDAVSIVDARPVSEAPQRNVKIRPKRSTAVSEVRLTAETRTEFGKGGARRTRRAGKVPAVIYGHGDDPRHVALPAREFANAIRHGGSHRLLKLQVVGGGQLGIPKTIR